MNKKSRNNLLGLIVFSVFTLSACGGGSSSDAVVADSGTSGSGLISSDTTGSGSADSGTADSGMTDSGMTDSGMTEPTVSNDIAASIQGAWVSECEVLSNDTLSARQIFVFNGSQLIRDWYEFDGNQCSGVPRGKRYPLLVDNYVFGADIVTSDGIAAKEIDLTLAQLPTSDYKPGFGEVVQTGLDVGTQRFTVVTHMNGKVIWQDREPTNADNRFNNFNNALELVPHTSLTSPDISPDKLYGAYKSDCMARDDGTYSFAIMIMSTENVERLQDHFYFNHLCLGDPAAITETPTTLEFGDVFTNEFGDTMISALRTRQQQFVVEGEELIDFELKSPRATRFGGYALAGDTLLLGDCIIRVDECKNTAEYPADHIDFEFNSSIRNVRTDSTEPAPGSTDTASIAGSWDGSYDTTDGGRDIFYYVVSNNGLATYYDYQKDSLGNGDDCYLIYTENLTSYDNNAYLYQGFYDDGTPYSYAEMALIENGELMFTSASGVSTTVQPLVADVSSFNECV